VSGQKVTPEQAREAHTLAELIDWLQDVKCVVRCTLVKFLGDYFNQQIADCHQSVIHFDAIAETCLCKGKSLA
jgi:hypothetical protein